jgi:hypothetical protein
MNRQYRITDRHRIQFLVDLHAKPTERHTDFTSQYLVMLANAT